MADEVTTTRKASSTPKEVDHVATVNTALDAARDAMIASGMSAGDADAYLNAARPSGTSTAVGNLADLNRSSGLPTVQAPVVPTIDEDRLAFAAKPPVEEVSK
jgi:hypothetical protein